MASDRSRSWDEVKRGLPVSEAGMAFYGRLMAAEQRLEQERERRGVSAADYDAAQVIDPATGEEETEDLARLALSVAALGGRLEVNAVFPDETIQLMIEPEIDRP
jgi:hypothetical protein